MRVAQRVSAWCGGHQGISSILVAAATLAVAVIGPRGPNEAPFPTPSPVGWVLVVLACVALVWRVRRPVEVWAVTLGLVLAGTLLDGAVGRALPAVLVALYTVAAHRPWRTAVGLAIGSAVLLLPTALVVSMNSPFSDSTYAILAFGGMVTAIGIAVRNQRAVVAAAEERARIAEQTREEEAQRRVAEERLRIARELHDVVAHHISVVNVQAGVARYLLTTDVAAADAALGNVREAAALVLRETGAIIGLLRTSEDPDGADGADGTLGTDGTVRRSPTPGLARLDDLVEDGRRAGLELAWTVTGTPRDLPPTGDLAAYRLVQEGLTNARRHGPGRARLLLAWGDRALLIEVRNPLRDKRSGASADSAGGFGLVGMRERVAAAGGRVDIGASGGEFVVRAELPYDLEPDLEPEPAVERTIQPTVERR